MNYLDRTFWWADLANQPIYRYKSYGWWRSILLSNRRYETQFEKANLVASKTTSGKHRPVIDLDRGFATVESTTPGHGHLYLDTEMSWPRYAILLTAMWWAGVIEPGFLLHSLRRGASFVRLPHVRKELP